MLITNFQPNAGYENLLGNPLPVSATRVDKSECPNSRSINLHSLPSSKYTEVIESP